jgi:hypothetical protein
MKFHGNRLQDRKSLPNSPLAATSIGEGVDARGQQAWAAPQKAQTNRLPTSPARRIPEYRRAGGLHVLLPDSLGKVSADEAYDVAVAGAVQINARSVMKTISYQKSRKTDESGKPKVRTAAAVTEVGHGGRVRGAPSGVLEPSCNVGDGNRSRTPSKSCSATRC